MSEHDARVALRGMHHQPAAIAIQHGDLISDMRQFAKADPVEEQVRLEQRQDELCQAYGFQPERENRKPFAYSSGVAIIPVHGTLINRFGSSWGYVTGYNFIRSQVAAAGQDADVKGIIFDLNSYGGQVAGCFECAADIPKLANGKPTLGVIDAACYSACYAIGSSLDRLVSTPSGGAGSIGVVAMHIDFSKALDDMGIAVTFIHAGAHKVDGNPYEPLSDEAKAEIQADVDKTYEKFVGLVSTNRSMDAKKVKDTEARTYRAEDAMSLGLIDEVASPSEAVASFFGELTGSNSKLQKEDSMSAQEKGPEADKAALAAAETAAKTAERTRVSGILNHAEAAGRKAMAEHLAFNTEMSVEDAAKMLAVAPKEGATKPVTNGFKEHMDKDAHPNVGSDAEAGGGEGDADSPEKAAASILANQELITGRKAAK